MTRPIDSDALSLVNRVLGIAGTLPGTTLLDDSNVSQILSLNDIIRRGRTIGVTQGWYYGVLETLHSGAGQEAASIDPYAPGAAAVDPYPAIVPTGNDVWLIGATVKRSAGSGDLTGGLLILNPPAVQAGWGIDESDNPISPSAQIALARFTGIDESLSSGSTAGISGDGSSYVRLNLRLARPSTLTWSSEAAAAATFRCIVILGLFPAGLGQDVAT